MRFERLEKRLMLTIATAADVNNDDVVTPEDALLVATAIVDDSIVDDNLDVNDDGIIDETDFGIIVDEIETQFDPDCVDECLAESEDNLIALAALPVEVELSIKVEFDDITYKATISNDTTSEIERIMNACIIQYDSKANASVGWGSVIEADNVDVGRFVRSSSDDRILLRVAIDDDLAKPGAVGQGADGKYAATVNPKGLFDYNALSGKKLGTVLAHEILFHAIGDGGSNHAAPGFIDSVVGVTGSKLSANGCSLLIDTIW